MEKNDVHTPKIRVNTTTHECTADKPEIIKPEKENIKTPRKCHLKPPIPHKKSRKRQASDSSLSEKFSKLQKLSPFHRRTKRIHSMGSACCKGARILERPGLMPLSPVKNKIIPVGKLPDEKSKEGKPLENLNHAPKGIEKKIDTFEVIDNGEKKRTELDRNREDFDLTFVCVAPDVVSEESSDEIEVNRKVKKTPSSCPDVRNKNNNNVVKPKVRSQSLGGLKTWHGGSNLLGTESQSNQPAPHDKKDSQSSINSTQLHVPRRFSQPLVEKTKVDKHGNNRVNYYQMLEEIGRGSFGAVRKCFSLRDHKYYAMKIISKSYLVKKYRMLARRPGKVSKGDPLETLYREIAILKKMDHLYIVKLIEVIDDPQVDNVYMVFELVSNGEVMKVPTDTPLSEDRARRYFGQLLLGIEYVHYSKIVHRDIKPSNLLLDDDDQIKIADFGVSIMFEDDSDLTNKSAGSPAFQAPEVLNYGSKDKYSGTLVDIWAMGVTLFCFVYGKCPFVHSNIMELCEMIKEKPVEFPDSPQVNPQCIDLISRMLAKNPHERITIGEIKVHPWVTDGGLYILPSTEEHCKMVQVTNEEISNSIKIMQKMLPFIYIKKMFEVKSFGINKKASQRNKSLPETSERNLGIS